MPSYDLVRPLKIESPQGGGTQFDMGPTELNPLQDALISAGIYVQDSTASAVDRVALVDRSGTSLRLTDAKTSRLLSELITNAAGQVASHNALIDLIHFLEEGPGDGWASGAVCIKSYVGPLLSGDAWFTDNTMAKKIVTRLYTYSGPLVTSVKTSLYAADGTTVAKVALDTITYNGPVQTSTVRTFPTS